MLRTMTGRDGPDVLRVLAEGIATGHSTFASHPGTWAEWDLNHLTTRLVWEDPEHGLVGWIALSPVSGRHVYEGVAEVSLYVSAAVRRRGLGRLLLERMVLVSAARGIWTLQSGIFPENQASRALFESCGFRVVGRRERIGRMSHGPMAGRWRDVLLYERRATDEELSPRVPPTRS